MRSDRDRLLDIQQAIVRIERYTRAGRSTLDDELIQTWVIHNLEVVGEAARAVSRELRERHPDLPWHDMVGMRDVLAHGYFRVDPGRVWTTVEKDLPKLKGQIGAILAATADRTEPSTDP